MIMNGSRQRLRVNGLSVAYNGHTVVHNADFETRDGEFLTLLGPSGCGKSTILRTIAGLIEPEKGSIYIDERCVVDAARHISVPAERRDLGMVFQSYAIWPHMSVRENVAYPLHARHVPRAEVDTAVGDMLALVGLSDFADRSATALSGGQQQRVAIARALVFQPKVLLLDEPLSNLDQKLRLEMGAEIRRIQTQAKVATIYVTHDQTEALMLSDRIAVLNEGRIEQIARPEEIYERPATPFVSWFVGKTNFVPCTIVSLSDVNNGKRQKLYVAIDGTEYIVEAAGALGMFRAGEHGVLTLRPEDFVLAREGHGLRVSVRERHYVGDRRHYLARFGEIELEFHAEKFPAFNVGDNLVLRVEHNRGVVFKDTETQLVERLRRTADPLEEVVDSHA